MTHSNSAHHAGDPALPSSSPSDVDSSDLDPATPGQAGSGSPRSVLDLHVPHLEAAIAPGLEAVEATLDQAIVGSRDLIDDLTKHLALAGGKRIRPVLTLVCAQLGTEGIWDWSDAELATPYGRLDLGQTSTFATADSVGRDAVVRAATAMELTHIASLYHDDVMDSAPTRRGVPSAQHLWGNNRAILAGDVLFARASKLIAQLGPQAVAFHACTFERLCLGQLNETFGPEPGHNPVEHYLQVLADKTGSLLAAAAHLGALTGGATLKVAHTVAAFGEKVGVAFQIADDVLDLASSGDTSGKTPGTDLREGVDTLPVLLLKARREAGTLDADGAAILEALDQDLSSDHALAVVVDALRRHDVLNETRELAHAWCDQAVAVLDGVPAGEVRDALEAFAHLMVDRVA